MRHAIISPANVVENVIELDIGFNLNPPEGYTVVQSDTANVNDTYENGNFTRHEPPRPPYAPDVQAQARVLDTTGDINKVIDSCQSIADIKIVLHQIVSRAKIT